MSIKVKLISCIAAIVLVLGIMFGAVLAAEQVQVNIGGSVSFTATSVHAMISGSVSGSTTANTLPNVTVDAETQDGTLAMGGDWSDMHLDFNEAGDDITVTINIQNLSDRTIYVSVADNTNISNVNVTRQAGASSIGATDNNRQVTANQTLTYTFELSIASKDNSVVNGNFALSMELSSQEKNNGFEVTIINNTTRVFYVFVGDVPVSIQSYGQYSLVSEGNDLMLSTRSEPDYGALNSVIDVTEEWVFPGAPGEPGEYNYEVNGLLVEKSIWGATFRLIENCTIRIYQ